MARIPVGRERELAAATNFIERHEARCSALVFEGEAGIGKTTVLHAAIDLARASGCQVLSCRPAENEASLPFVSLGDLLEPAIPAAFATLPAAQRSALETALARVEPGETFGRLAVSRATLAVLGDLAIRTPLLIAIDDEQWLDRSSAEVLGFSLRRLPDSAIRVLLTRRTGPGADPIRLLSDIPRATIAIGPLSVDQLGSLIADQLDPPLTRPRLVELHTTTGGNPYFALEIVRAVRARGEPICAGEALPVPDDIAALLRERISGLSAAAIDALLLSAASPQATVSLIASANGSPAGLAEALSAGILEQDGDRLRFTHPLLASVVYHGADPQARREAHVRLAAAVADPDERAVYLAHATSEPDADVAAELDEAAGRAYRRAAPAAAAELEEQACRLTPAELGDERSARTLRGAEYHLAAGDTERGRALLERLLEARRFGPERARIALRLGNVRYLTDDVAGAHQLFGEARAHAGGDDRLLVEAEQALAFTSMLGGDILRALKHARSSLLIAQRLNDARALALAECRVALNEFLAGQGFDRPRFERAIELEAPPDEIPFEWLPMYAYAGVAAMADHLDTARTLYERLAHVAVTHGDERAMPTLLFATSELECRLGNWARAARLAADAIERSRQIGLGTLHAWALYAQALVHAHIGDVDAARAETAEGLRLAQTAGAIAQVTQITSTLGFLELSLGDYAAANAQLGPLSELVAGLGLAEPGVVRFMPNQIEALIGLGDLDGANRLLVVLEERARTLDRISARAAAARCRALLAAAEGNFEQARASVAEALAQHGRLDEPFELGRTLLAQGIAERRAKRRADARTALNGALEQFDSLGAALWAEKAASELARIPGRPPASQRLSETEQRVAELAAQGLSNKEIAARLFVTVRTVEAHLSNTYSKLGVRSRAQLAARAGGQLDS